ncbi:hypothetical protein HK097_008311 [Rhizophlyctis rosea]|uniref:Phenylalanine--tRNA ligase, mitochondrial n=1 Tax=Rhizophlyctis rosea TaxID=64517 RepID=A0AAD5X4M1_9FUNG|nr:hypothetical protein HK097_008311 [Rhizophlyctis rosea]
MRGGRYILRVNALLGSSGKLAWRQLLTALYSSAAAEAKNSTSQSPTLEILGQSYPTDTHTNTTPTILSKLSRNLHLQPSHPLNTLKRRIESHFSTFTHLDNLNPVVTTTQNFDDLLFEPSHPGRSKTDTYYINSSHVLRTHTSAHQSDVLRNGKSNGYLLTADVYRRDEIDVSHYPVFHQMEGIRIFPRSNLSAEISSDLSTLTSSAPSPTSITDIPTSDTNPIQSVHTKSEADLVTKHLKTSLESMVKSLFRDETLQIRWIEAYFPFTSPSWEMEILYQDKWLEILGCGVVQQQILDSTGHADKVGWAFGLGLERIAMVLFDIPDIRLFWSEDKRFLSQFREGEVTTFKPFSKYPACYKDISFWCPAEKEGEKWHDNDFAEIVRDVAGDLAENVRLIDQFTHPKKGTVSRCFRINYRSMERTVTNEEIDRIQDEVRRISAEKLGVTLR